ncbi:hypothetical protein BC827DRAFT_1159384 [Russula dissimulans]|nr:hypothetical protein BC827DRAFT_1159384 [Russula dissimulans]
MRKSEEKKFECKTGESAAGSEGGCENSRWATGASDSVPPKTPVSSPGRSETVKGKRKAEDVDITLPIPKRPRAFLAPSSYPNSKRARLSAPSPSPAPPNTNARNTGTYSSRTSSRVRAPSSTRSGTDAGPPANASERDRRRSLSQRSIPISALVTPQVPSIGRASTRWALRLSTTDEVGSPVQAWLFYLALVLFPLWWVGAVWRVPQTRTVGGTDTEKAVPLDDPQIEFVHAFLAALLPGPGLGRRPPVYPFSRPVALFLNVYIRRKYPPTTPHHTHPE